MAMSAESPEHTIRLPRCQRGPEAIPKDGQGFEVDADEAVTPAVVSVEPMIVLDASGNEVEPQVPGARTQEQRGEEEEAKGICTPPSMGATLHRVKRLAPGIWK